MSIRQRHILSFLFTDYFLYVFVLFYLFSWSIRLTSKSKCNNLIKCFKKVAPPKGFDNGTWFAEQSALES